MSEGMHLYNVINGLGQIVAEGFSNKMDAKKTRDEMMADEKARNQQNGFFVGRGPDHYRGPSPRSGRNLVFFVDTREGHENDPARRLS